MALPSEPRLSHFEVLAPARRGGIGEVYRALDTHLGREVSSWAASPGSKPCCGG